MASAVLLLVFALAAAVSCHIIAPRHVEEAPTVEKEVPISAAGEERETLQCTAQEAVPISAAIEDEVPISSTVEEAVPISPSIEEAAVEEVVPVPESSDAVAAPSITANLVPVAAKPSNSCAQIGDRCVHHNDCCSNSCLGYYKRCVS